MGAPLRVLSLCSGVGGLDLGVRRVLDCRVVAAVERDPFAASILLERMEESALDACPLWVGDLRDLDPEPLAGHIDMVVGGFPCPPFSVLGEQLGAEDERDIWPEVLRIIRGVGASYAFLENVWGAVRHPDGLGRWLGELAQLGFDAEYATVLASDAGAPHPRRRLFLLAHPSDGHGGGGERTAEAGAGEDGQRRGGSPSGGEALADGGSERSQGDGEGRTAPRATRRGGGAEVSAWPPDQLADWSSVPQHLHPATRPSATQLRLRRVAHGLPDLVDLAQLHRIDRLRVLGNAVVPAQAEYALRLLLARIAP